MLVLKTTYIKQTLFILAFFTVSLIFGQNETFFKRGNDLYNQGKYQEAITMYQKVIDQNKHSAELYFNLGNAHYKLNNIAPSVYNFEKALVLAPNDKDIKNNMAFTHKMMIDAIDVVPEVGFNKMFKSAVNTYTFDGWAKLSVGLAVGFGIIFLLYYFASNTTQKRLAFIASFLCLFLAIASLTFAFKKSELDNSDKPAIVFARESLVKSDPNTASSDLFRLHEGTKVQILETFDSWKKIKLTDGKIGWIPSEDIKPIQF